MQSSEFRVQNSASSIASQLRSAALALVPVAKENAMLEARVLASHAWGMSAEALVRDHDDIRDAAPLQALVERRMRAEPVAHIVGEKDFWRDRFLVSQNVLTPRADSETMLENMLRLRPDTDAAYRLLDLGTGSGCLLLSALREYRHASGVGVDQSTAALAVAAKNAAALGLDTRAAFLHSDWCSHVSGTFDVVLANPPYIPSADIATLDADVRVYEPHAALDGGADGLNAYRTIMAQIRPHLNPDALVLFEVGMGQANDVATLVVAHGFTLHPTTPDLAGIARVVACQFTL